MNRISSPASRDYEWMFQHKESTGTEIWKFEIFPEFKTNVGVERNILFPKSIYYFERVLQGCTPLSQILPVKQIKIKNTPASGSWPTFQTSADNTIEWTRAYYSFLQSDWVITQCIRSVVQHTNFILNKMKNNRSTE